MPLSLPSASQLSRSSRAPLPRWKRATGSCGRPRRFFARRIIPGRRAQQRLLHRLARPAATATSPAGRALASAARSSGVSALEFSDLRSRSSQRGEVRRRRQRDEGLEPRILARNLLHHLLDQEIAERHAGKPALAVGDRIEHRGRGLVRLDAVALHRQDRRDRVGNVARQRDLDEDQRLVDQRRMEERVAAPVRRIDAAAQIVPARGCGAPPRSG